jgi:hypothetical protein
MALAWLVLSLSARRSGLFGEVLRDLMRRAPGRGPAVLGLVSKFAESALNARLKLDGDRGVDVAVLVRIVRSALFVNNVNRDGLEGDRESERRICLMVAKPSICGLCGCVGDSIWMGPQAVWRGEYSNSMPVAGLLDESLRVSQLGRRVDEASSGCACLCCGATAYKYAKVCCVMRYSAVRVCNSLKCCLDAGSQATVFGFERY